jgi:hypothetical protein
MTLISVNTVTNERIAHQARAPTGIPRPKRKAKAYDDLAICTHAIGFFKTTELDADQQPISLRAYTKEHCPSIPRATFQRHFKKSGLQKMKEGAVALKELRSLELQEADVVPLQEADNGTLKEAEAAIKAHMETINKHKKSRTVTASIANRFLTDNEEIQIVELCRVLAAMGQGVTTAELLIFINEYLNDSLDERERHDATQKTARLMLRRHKDLAKIVSAGSLDPKRANQATEETRDSVFVKLDAFIKLLHAQFPDKVPWTSIHDVKNTEIYNMDEVANDTTKHRAKVIADAIDFVRVFQITPEGDGKMSGHITIALTTRADGT